MKIYRKFTSNDFKVNGELFTGYVNKTATGFVTDVNQQATPAGTFNSKAIELDYDTDRIVSEPQLQQLPFSLNECLIESNEIATAYTINAKLQQLAANNVYIYTQLRPYTSNIPSGQVTYIAINPKISNEPQWFSFTTQTLPWSTTTFAGDPEFNVPPEFQFAEWKYLDNVVGSVGVTFKENENIFCTINIEPTHISVLSGDKANGIQTILRRKTIEDVHNKHTFQELAYIARHGNTCYVTDKKANVVYKLDVRGITEQDPTLSSTINLLQIIGGKGRGVDKTFFNTPTLLAVTNDHLAVYDSGNVCIKVYDLNFNYKTTLTSLPGKILAMEFNPYTNDLWLVTEENNFAVFHIVDINGTIKNSFKNVIRIDSEVKSLKFSKNDSSVVYFATRNNIFKLLSHRPTNIIGRFKLRNLHMLSSYVWNKTFITWNCARFPWNTGGNQSTTLNVVGGIDIISSNNDYDKFFLFNTGRLYVFNEPNLFARLLNNEQPPRYNEQTMLISKEEIVQAFTLNKELYKVAFNLTAIKNSIIGNLKPSVDSEQYLVNDGADKTLEFDKLSLSNVQNLFVHENERVDAAVVNRAIETLHNLQATILRETRAVTTDVERVDSANIGITLS